MHDVSILLLKLLITRFSCYRNLKARTAGNISLFTWAENFLLLWLCIWSLHLNGNCIFFSVIPLTFSIGSWLELLDGYTRSQTGLYSSSSFKNIRSCPQGHHFFVNAYHMNIGQEIRDYNVLKLFTSSWITRTFFWITMGKGGFEHAPKVSTE